MTISNVRDATSGTPSRSRLALAGRCSSRWLAGLVLLLSAGAAQAEVDGPRIAVLGDSLTAGYGLPPEHAFPAKLEAVLRAAGLEATVVNAGVSGDTTAGGLSRLDWVLADRPDHVIVALGANDALRGLDPDQAFANLDAILTRLDAAEIPALLVGMPGPRNLGADYAEAFGSIYPRLAERHGVPLYGFFLDGVALDPALNLEDGMHPNAAGVEVMAERIAPLVIDWLETG